MTTTIGVTGHRILTELDKIGFGIDQALQRIREVFGEQPLTIVSSLAEGADRIVVHQVLALQNSKLVAPLPVSESDYLTDFESTESKSEFLSLLARADQIIELPPTTMRDQAYEAAGLYVLDHADALIAIWDGQAAQGTGGTGGIV